MIRGRGSEFFIRHRDRPPSPGRQSFNPDHQNHEETKKLEEEKLKKQEEEIEKQKEQYKQLQKLAKEFEAKIAKELEDLEVMFSRKSFEEEVEQFFPSPKMKATSVSSSSSTTNSQRK